MGSGVWSVRASLGTGVEPLFGGFRAHFTPRVQRAVQLAGGFSAAQGHRLELRADLPKKFLIRIPTRE
jgi:hypothetical protein